jgi:hypothetical protein
LFEKRVLRRIFGPKRDEVMGKWRKLLNGELHNLYSSPDITGRSNQGEPDGWGMWHAWERGKMCREFWQESPKEKDHLEDHGIDGKMGSKWTSGRLAGGGGGWSGFTWLRIGTVGGLL